MTTTQFLLTVALAAAIQGGCFFVVYKSTLKKLVAEQPAWRRSDDESRRLQSLHAIGSLLFGLLFTFLIFFLADPVSPLTPISGLLYGLGTGVLVYVPTTLSWLAMLALPIRLALGFATGGVVAGALAGLAAGLVL